MRATIRLYIADANSHVYFLTRELQCTELCKGEKKSLRALAQKLLGFEIIFSKQWRVEELRNTDAKPLAHFVDHTKLYGIVGAVDQVTDGRFRDTTLDIQLIIGHIPFLQQFGNSFADGFFQLHLLHHTSL